MPRLYLIFLVFISFLSNAQNFQEQYQLRVAKSALPLKIDGELDEEVWQRAIPIGDFWEKFPSDKNKALLNTTVKAAYDNKFLYVAITSFDSTNRYIAPSLKRDATIVNQDGVAIVLDPVNKKSNGFNFATTPYNVQTEYQFGAVISGNGPNTAWDNKWFSSAKRYPDRYVLEMAIPFKTLRYDPSITTWGVNFIRSDQKNNKFYSWTNVPVQFPGIDLGYLGALVFEGELPHQKGNVSFIPYITGSVAGNAEENLGVKGKLNAGFDAKVSLTPSMNLDLTVNPDFSQIEVDRQVTNLTRFNIFFPERRTFFLENDDIFSSYGAPPFRPFFSRTIGLDKNGNAIPILFGARISGNVTKGLRIGAFNMQTARKGSFAPQNYSAASFNQRISGRSSIKGYFLNREGNLNEEEKRTKAFDKFGRNAGMELSLRNKSGKWEGWAGYHISMKPTISDKNSFYQIGGAYTGNKFAMFTDLGNFGVNYYADMGFINRSETFSTKGNLYDSGDTTIRIGFKQSYTEASYTIRPKDKMVNSHSLGIENYAMWFSDGKLSDRTHTLRYLMFFRNTSVLRFRYNVQQDNLRYYFPLPSEKPLIPGQYFYNSINVLYASDTRKNVLLEGSLLVGDFYNGKIQQYRAGLTVRRQPWWNVTINVEYNDIKFPTEYGNTKLWLISPKGEISFSNNLFWTTFFQYNTQRNNFNINSRFQWRYSPMSDFFLVYTDNYFTDPFMKNKNRALVFKLNYWLTV